MPRDVMLDVDDTDLKRVIRYIDEGKYRIPEFQREFVWDRTDVVDLFDSIYNKFPIGSFFFWRVPENMWDFFRDLEGLHQPSLEDVKRGEFPGINFVLDGQQRLTSLYVTLQGMEYQGTDYSRIVFDLDEQEFKVADGKANHLVRLCDIWDDRREVRDKLSERRETQFHQCFDILRDYELPVIRVSTSDIDSVINIFERINQKGTRLSRFDIVNANIWSQEFNLRRRISEDIFGPLEDMGFGEIERGSVTQTLAMCLEETATTDAQKNLDPVEVQAVWPDIEEAIISAVSYLRNKHGVRRSEFIPYEGMVPVLAYYMYNTGRQAVHPDHQDQIDRWFWRAALARRYSSSAQTRMTEDTRKLDQIINEKEIDINFPPAIDTASLKNTNIKRSTSGIRNAFLCLLARNRPLHFEDGTEIELTNEQYINFRLHKHHIFPNAFLRDQGYSQRERKSIMDITFIPRELNLRLSDTSPKEYFGELKQQENFEEIMESHLIPAGEDSGIWENDYDKFLDQRAELVYTKFMDLIGEYSRLETGLRSNPNQAIEEVETEVRDYVHQRMSAATDSENYWNQVPNAVTSNVQRRISKEQDSNPEFTVDSDREKLDFCDIMDYAKIINGRWDVFEDDFPSTNEVQNRFEDFSNLRNAIAHNREIDQFTRLDGQVAIEWIDTCIGITTAEEIQMDG